jgi:hypothetical protein
LEQPTRFYPTPIRRWTGRDHNKSSS